MAGNQDKPHWGLLKPPPDPNGRLDEQPRWGLGVADGRYGPPVGRDWIRSLAHPVQGYRRWAQRRRLGPYAPDEHDPEPKG